MIYNAIFSFKSFLSKPLTFDTNNDIISKHENSNKILYSLRASPHFAVTRCASSSLTKARGAIIEFALVSKLPDANFLDYRGVAKLVSRQFRVLETVGSSPATSTKTVRKTVFFLFGRRGELSHRGFDHGSKKRADE